MDGFRVEPMDGRRAGDVFITVTGDTRRGAPPSISSRMTDGAIVANSGHFDVELDLVALGHLAEGRRRAVRPIVEEFVSRTRRRIQVLAEGRLVNLAAAEGHPAAVMDMSFANQALARSRWCARRRTLTAACMTVPATIDARSRG